MILQGKQSWETCETEQGSVLYFRVAQGSSLEDQPALGHKEQEGSLSRVRCLQPLQMGLQEIFKWGGSRTNLEKLWNWEPCS